MTIEAERVIIDPNGTVHVHAYPDAVVCAVGKDRVSATIMSREGEMLVKLECDGEPFFQHTFTYTPPRLAEQAQHQAGTNGNGNGTPPAQKRPRGRPRLSDAPIPVRPLSMDDEFK